MFLWILTKIGAGIGLWTTKTCSKDFDRIRIRRLWVLAFLQSMQNDKEKLYEDFLTHISKMAERIF